MRGRPHARCTGDEVERGTHNVGNFLEIDEIDGTHRFADPLGHGVGGNGKTDVIQRLEKFGRNVMLAVLVIDDRDRGNSAIRQAVNLLPFLRALQENGIGPRDLVEAVLSTVTASPRATRTIISGVASWPFNTTSAMTVVEKPMHAPVVL